MPEKSSASIMNEEEPLIKNMVFMKCISNNLETAKECSEEPCHLTRPNSILNISSS